MASKRTFISVISSPLRGHGLRRSPFVRYLLSLTRPDHVAVFGYRMYVDRQDAVVTRDIAHGKYEPLETAVIKQMVEPGQTVIDIGANVGYYTLILAERVGAAGAVHAFEPAPRSRALLEKNINVNGFKNVTVYPMALSDGEGSAQLFLNEYNAGDNRLYESSDMPSVTVPLKPLDMVLSPVKKVDFIKMDIQGSELNALRGMQRLLAASRPVLITEYSPQSIKRTGGTAADLLNLLSSLGYTFVELDEEAFEIRPITKDQLIAQYPETEERFTNIVALPEGRRAPSIAVL